jgi:hypothetical protein
MFWATLSLGDRGTVQVSHKDTGEDVTIAHVYENRTGEGVFHLTPEEADLVGNLVVACAKSAKGVR